MAVLRYSKQRESIKNYLYGREDHPTADMIYTSIREEYPNISLGTIYRNLSLLVEIGEIQKITTDGAVLKPQGGPVRCQGHTAQSFCLPQMWTGHGYDGTGG